MTKLIKMDEPIKKLNKCNNNVKLVLQLLKTMDEKINEKKGLRKMEKHLKRKA